MQVRAKPGAAEKLFLILTENKGTPRTILWSLPESQGRNLALNVLFVPCSLDSGTMTHQERDTGVREAETHNLLGDKAKLRLILPPSWHRPSISQGGD